MNKSLLNITFRLFYRAYHNNSAQNVPNFYKSITNSHRKKKSKEVTFISPITQIAVTTSPCLIFFPCVVPCSCASMCHCKS